MTPTDWIKLMARYLLLAASGLGMLWLVWHQGYERGAGDVRLEVATQKTREAGDALQKFIDGAKLLTAEANKAGNALAAQVAARQAADQQSTREIKDALKKTASQRVMCVFDDDVMRLLREARQRAATAAADGLSGGDDRKVPAPGGSGR
ncbi:TPA: hypothetical protein MNL42_005228 [Klebsiella pneumoniae]|uniref:hypothetical protein n=1 Tax=Klebsiella pneumoniae complex TaxID=3390273 RepID=UPI000E3E8585|nr:MULTISPECIES: hypothetical protein [Klebsiella]ELA0194565.1 hypothetical protein [Klebsiella pneumoniae]ELB4172935.1 hypothetical protein [Klebsiella pneumoniae]ELB4540657.1 hypothetical protein [Klebsiella pneumoniae]ELB4933386.1 hypothetical protein [Klebsiella pneumoniae]ELB5607462.1 hypothetical protein [Klebsiella pneumoniae]